MVELHDLHDQPFKEPECIYVEDQGFLLLDFGCFLDSFLLFVRNQDHIDPLVISWSGLFIEMDRSAIIPFLQCICHFCMVSNHHYGQWCGCHDTSP
ncbi:Uncharacterised protein [Mycobacterium tuberculosis]|nr:Uncharacterised protein [Mycobacterium tuberculosis]